MSFDHMSQGELVALSRDATELPRSEKLISLEKKYVLAAGDTQTLLGQQILRVVPTLATVFVCLSLLFASAIFLFAILVFSTSDFQLCAVCVMFMADSVPLSLWALSAVIICMCNCSSWQSAQ